ncbi:hypothetical protein JX265_010997 [Neoarthrinium moseri]|uniref:Uncharacterized protein n=1 Tax=Neoarthrinium moseri TaxID=1658444 RepID=A0A9P9WDE3_9PEZI|nr:hypothetical protein JX265_010997 [Neoarthrinium moseri]
MLHYPRHHPQFPSYPAETTLFNHNIPGDLDFNPIPWHVTIKKLAYTWRFKARQLRRKRGVVRILTPIKASAVSPGRCASAPATSAKAFGSEGDASRKRFGTGVSAGQSTVLCQESNSFKDDVNLSLKDLDSNAIICGYSPELQQQLRGLDGSMEKDKKARAAQKSSHSQPRQNASRGQTPEQLIALKRREGVEAVMAVFQTWLDKRLAIIDYAVESSEVSGGFAGGSSTEDSGDGKTGSSSGSGRGKRQFNGDDDTNGSSSGGDGKRGGEDRGGNKRAKKDAEKKPMFACPYFQHDPRRHCTHRSCVGPGWPSIHRLKEHLFRRHRLPSHMCPRCREPMDNDEALEEHLRSDIPCTKRDVIRVQGIDDAQEKKLKERKKTSASLTEEQKWKDIYVILFPQANKNALPSPYYENGDPVSYAKSAEQWKKFKKHIQRELPSAVRKRVEHRFDGVQAEVLDGLGDIVRDSIFHILKGMPGGSGSAPTSAPASPSPGPVSRSATPKASLPMPADDAKDLNMSSFMNDPNAPFSFFGGFAMDDDFGQPFDFNIECQSDSGYASNSTAAAPTMYGF